MRGRMDVLDCGKEVRSQGGKTGERQMMGKWKEKHDFGKWWQVAAWSFDRKKKEHDEGETAVLLYSS